MGEGRPPHGLALCIARVDDALMETRAIDEELSATADRSRPGASIVWNSALFEIGDGDPFDIAGARRIALFSSLRLRLRQRGIHTQADPFLFVQDDKLYLFMEVQAFGEPGHIEAYRTIDLRTFEPLGVILSRDHHLSYPLVFADRSAVHLLPESSAAGEVVLYGFDAFPFGVRPLRTLLRGAYRDPTIVHHDGYWWLFATSDDGLELFYASTLEDRFVRHPASPISGDPAFYRCGGAIVPHGGRLYRPAQDGAAEYGRNLHLMRIETLSCDAYEEVLERRNMFDCRQSWNARGGHHISIARFAGKWIVAVDGKQRDYRFDRLLPLLSRLIAPRRGAMGLA